MNKIDEELRKNLVEWSEGNEYLYSLLYLSWQHGIKTGACCGGHADHKNNDPYIMFIVDDNSMSYIESMIGALEEVPDMHMVVSYRTNPRIPDEEKLTFCVHANMYNRMSVFYRLADSIVNRREIKTLNGKSFYDYINRLLHRDKTEIEYDVKTGIIVSRTLSTNSNDYIDYSNNKRKILYRLKQALKQASNYSKFDINQEKIDESPQIRY